MKLLGYIMILATMALSGKPLVHQILHSEASQVSCCCDSHLKTDVSAEDCCSSAVEPERTGEESEMAADESEKASEESCDTGCHSNGCGDDCHHSCHCSFSISTFYLCHLTDQQKPVSVAIEMDESWINLYEHYHSSPFWHPPQQG